MQNDNHDQEQRDIQNALKALASAQQKSQAAGRSVVVVRGNRLVRVGSHGEQVIKTVGSRPRVLCRTKRSQ